MSKFTDTVKSDTPQLVVLYKFDDGRDMFNWGMVGQMPAASLIGRITIAQFQDWADECPDQRAVFAWDAAERKVEFFFNNQIPWEPFVGMLELIKFSLISSQLSLAAAANQNRQTILGPDGVPMNGQTRPIRRT